MTKKLTWKVSDAGKLCKVSRSWLGRRCISLAPRWKPGSGFTLQQPAGAPWI